MSATSPTSSRPTWRVRSDAPFYLGLGILGGSYLLLIAGMLLAEASFTSFGYLQTVLADHRIQYSIKLSLVSCSMTTLLALWVAVPLGYVLSRYRFPGKALLDALVDIPIVLPPLVIGLALIVLFRNPAGDFLETNILRFTLAVPGVILAQFSVACAFAVRTMRVTFDQIHPRQEQVALTLGCSRGQAFWRVVLPEARRGLITAATLAWARSLGEFGPVFAFAGVTRMRTEVLASTVFLELNEARIERAAAVSLLMVVVAAVVLVIVRVFGLERVPLEGR
jgi:molybdate transport system permease protein